MVECKPEVAAAAEQDTASRRRTPRIAAAAANIRLQCLSEDRDLKDNSLMRKEPSSEQEEEGEEREENDEDEIQEDSDDNNQSGEDDEESSEDDLFECKYCRVLFPSLHETRRHISHFHKKEHECDICQEKFRSEDTVCSHKEQEHSDVLDNEQMQVVQRERERLGKRVPCTICFKMVTNRQALTYHMRLHSGAKVYGCQKCDETFVAKLALRAHVKQEHPEEKAAFVAKVEFSIDVRPKTEQESHMCSSCGKIFHCKNLLKQHERSHTGYTRTSCTECGRSLANKSSVRHHMGRHNPDTLKCNQCDFVSTCLGLLKTHKTTAHFKYGGPKKTEANSPNKSVFGTPNMCGTGTPNAGDTGTPNAGDTGTPNAGDTGTPNAGDTSTPNLSVSSTPNISDPNTPTKSTSTDHIVLSPVEKKPLICASCSQIFVTRSDLQAHTKEMHPLDELHECEVCKRVVKTNYLASHMMLHSGEKPFVCPTCGKAYAQKSSLRFHRQTHENTRIYFQCDICQKRFPRKSALEVHRRMHGIVFTNAVVSHKCDTCGLKYSTEEEFEQHNCNIEPPFLLPQNFPPPLQPEPQV